MCCDPFGVPGRTESLLARPHHISSQSPRNFSFSAFYPIHSLRLRIIYVFVITVNDEILRTLFYLLYFVLFFTFVQTNSLSYVENILRIVLECKTLLNELQASSSKPTAGEPEGEVNNA